VKIAMDEEMLPTIIPTIPVMMSLFSFGICTKVRKQISPTTSMRKHKEAIQERTLLSLKNMESPCEA